MSSSNLIDKIIFNDILDSNTKAIYKETVEIFNNETFTLDFEGITFNTNQEGVDNVELLKANIDWGDGSSETIYKRLYSSTSSIGTYETTSWKRVTHLYNTDKKNIYLTDDVRSLPKITITLYNTFNDSVKIYIPYKLVYKSIYDLGTSFKMLSANISNDNHSSFVIKNKNDESLMIVGVKNWKKIYGEDDIVYIEDDNVSKDYADQFVNEDSMVWDWDAVPQIALNVKLMGDVMKDQNGVVLKDENGYEKYISWFECDFSEKTVNLDYWQPHCFMMKDDENSIELKQIVVNEGLRKFYIYNSFEGVRKPLQIGMYKVYVKMIGVNGVEGISNVRYIKSDEMFFADKLRLPFPQKDYFYITDEADKNIIFNYTLPSFAYTSHIESAYVNLQAIRIDDTDEGIQKGTEEEYFETFKEPNYPLTFTYDLLFDNDTQVHNTIIPSNSIPNGIYDVSIAVRQKTKTADDASQKNIYTYKEVEEDVFENVVYKIPNLKLNYYGVGSVSFDKEPQITIDDCKIEWNISDALEMRNVFYRVSKINEDGKIETYVQNKSQNYQNYNFERNDDTYTFNEIINTNEIDDGKYRIEVGHVIPMSDYVGQRQIVLNQQMNFQYITPKMEVQTFVPYLKRSGDKLIPSFRVQIKDELGEEVGGVQYNYNYSQGIVTELLGEKLIHDIPYNGQSFTFTVKSYNIKDNIYKRKRKEPTVYEVRQDKSIPHDVENVIFTNENATATVSYIRQSDETQIFGSNLTRNSIYNIPKKYKWVGGDEVYYSYDLQPNYFSYNGISKPCLFKTEIYRQKYNSSKKILRFVPNIQPIQNITLEPLQLPTVKEYLDEKQINVDYKYNRKTDRCQLVLGSRFSVYEKDPLEVNDAVITLYREGEKNYTTNIRNNFQSTIGSLKVGKYDLTIQFHSINTDNTSDYVYTLTSDSTSGLNLLVSDTQVLSYSHYLSRGIDNSRYFNIDWTLYHKSLKSLELHTQLVRQFIYEWHAYEYQVDSQGNPIQMYDYQTDENGNYVFDTNGKLIPKYQVNEDGQFVLDENGNKKFVYLTFKDNGRDTGIPMPMPKFKKNQKFQFNYEIAYLYQKDSKGNYLRDENGEYIPIINRQTYKCKIVDNVTICPREQTQNTSNQSYEMPIILQSKDEITYWFQFDGDYIKWSDDNKYHRLPFKKPKITIS